MYLKLWKTCWEKEKKLVTSLSLFYINSFQKASSAGLLKLGIHAIRPGLSGTVPDFDILSRRTGNHEIVPEIKKIKSTDFLRPIEHEEFVINSCLNDKCFICCCVLIIRSSGIPVVNDRH